MKKTNQIGALFLSVLIMLQAFPASAPAEGSAEYRPAQKFWSVSFGEKTYLVEDGYTISVFPDPPQEEGKLFLGWYDGDTKVEPPFTPEGDVKLTPRFEEAGPEDQRTLEFSVEGGAVVSLTGLFPEDCTLSVTDEQQPLPIKFMAYRRDAGPDLSAVELYTYNITLRNPDGTEFQPEGRPVTVTIRGSKFEEALGQGRSIHVIHVAEEGKTDEITDLSVHKDQVSFSVDHFSEFRFMGQYDLADWEEKLETDDVTVSLSGLMPLGAEAEAVSAAPELEEGELLAAADISLFNSGVSVQPASWKGTLTVRMSSEAITQAVKAGDDIAVYHAEADGTMTRLEEEAVKLTDEGVEFTADAFSVYVVAGDSMESTIVAGDGNTYKITLTFKEDAVLPDGAALRAEELTGEAAEDYLGRTAVFMNAGGFAYGRVFDISIVDGEGTTVQPEAAVEVSIELLDAPESAGTFSVVHFAEEYDASSETGTYERAETVAAETEGNTVSFAAESFSAYAIVTGPSAIPMVKVSGMEELATLEGQGIYIGHVDGYYLTDGITQINNSRTGITKTKPAESNPSDASSAVKYYFIRTGDETGNTFIICCGDGENRRYVTQSANSLNLTNTESAATVFTVEPFDNLAKTFRIKGNDGYYWNMQGGANGASFAAYQNATDVNAKLYFWYKTDVVGDPYDLDGHSYGLMNWSGSVTGRAMMAEPSQNTADNLNAKVLTVMTSNKSGKKEMFDVAMDEDVTMWTFEWQTQDQYFLKADTGKYLKAENGVISLVDQADATLIQVIPGSSEDNHAGQIALKAGDTFLTYSGNVQNGFTAAAGSSGSEWLYLLAKSELTSDYFRIFSAREVSVSDPEIQEGSKVLVYCRVWNEQESHYDFYAIDHEGKLVPCYESGSELQWVGSKLNNLLWQFADYGNYYYELYNEYGDKFIAPQSHNGQVLSDSPIGINLNGRESGAYYTTLVAWDDARYACACIKANTETGMIEAIPFVDASETPDAVDFAFAIINDLPNDDQLTTVATVDHTRYGITMKIVNFDGKIKGNGCDTSQKQTDVMGENTYTGTSVNQNLASRQLSGGYPIATLTGRSFSELFSGAREVNHLFLSSVYRSSGYFLFDSTQNFASLDGSGNFTVYKELGTHDSSNKETLKHGQFFPYNDIEPGLYAVVNGRNRYTATANPLPASDPRYNERLHLVRDTDYFFGVELEASFVQTPDGKDDWGHDIIYEFTGDDDFWLYVDGELIIDLGGIHSAMGGSVNYRTGKVVVNGTQTSLLALFAENHGLSMDQAIAQFATGDDAIFVQKTINGETCWTFRDNTPHTMRIFYMERGAGASNLRMRFNLSSVRQGTVQLTKKLGNMDSSDGSVAEFPFQIYYKPANDGREQRLKLDSRPVVQDNGEVADVYNVVYKDTNRPVRYTEDGFTIDGVEYKDVFFLKDGETADIDFGMPTGEEWYYRIVECGVDDRIYHPVRINNVQTNGDLIEGSDHKRDYWTDSKKISERPTVTYQNDVTYKPKLSITKKLYTPDGVELKGYGDDDSVFNFRLYLGAEFDEPVPTYMYVYYVKDPNGYYCRWNEAAQRFASVGITDFSVLLDPDPAMVEIKKSVTHHSSVWGSITKIPAGYTVEIRDMLPGTKYIVEERDYEIPDGYILNGYEVKKGGQTIRQDTPPLGAFDEKDVEVTVSNLIGFGLRVNKEWSDAEAVENRDPTYFAVYRDRGGTMELVEDSVKIMYYRKNAATATDKAPDPQTLRWYIQELPEGASLNEYFVREVSVTGNNLSVSADGTVTGYDRVVMIDENAGIELHRRLIGTESDELAGYTVHYNDKAPEKNVRVFEVKNETKGILLKKEDWEGQPLAGATFKLLKLTDDGSIEIGSYTSAETTGVIQEVFLESGSRYQLAETAAPGGYHGLESPVTIWLEDGRLNADSSADLSYYDVYNPAPGDSDDMPALTVRDRPFTFKAVKVEAENPTVKVKGAEFKLLRQKIVDGQEDWEPVYERLASGTNGIIPQVDQTLQPGTYKLQEIKTPSGYKTLSGDIRFTISQTGTVTLDQGPAGVTLDVPDPLPAAGALEYTLTIPNEPVGFLKIVKNLVSTPSGISAPSGMKVKVTVKNAENLYLQNLQTPYVFDANEPEEPIEVPVTSAGLVIPDLPVGTYTVAEILGTDNEYVQVEGYRYDSTDYLPSGGSVTVSKTNTKSNPARVTITNRYTKLVEVTLRKAVAGNMADIYEDFTFDIKVFSDAGCTVPFVKTDGDDWKTSVIRNGSQGAISIGHFPVGVYVKITESENGAVYDTIKANVNGGEDETLNKEIRSFVFAVPGLAEGKTEIPVVFTNTRNVSVDTGLFLDCTPYLGMLAIALVGLVCLAVRRRKRMRNA